MKEIIGTIYAFIGSLIIFILGCINTFSTEKTLKKLYFKRTKLSTKLDEFFSREPPTIYIIRISGWVAIIFSIFGLIIILVKIFKR